MPSFVDGDQGDQVAAGDAGAFKIGYHVAGSFGRAAVLQRQEGEAIFGAAGEDNRP